MYFLTLKYVYLVSCTDENFNFKIPILHNKVSNIELKAQISNKYQCFLTKRILCLRGSKQIKN